jgi:hypothetical protein
MTAIAVAPHTKRAVVLVLVLVLALHESRRLVLHPVMLVGWAMFFVMLGVNMALDTISISAFDMITTGATFYPGLFCVLAAHMVTTRDSRSGTDELIGAAPATPEQRVLGLLLAAWVPALIALGANFAARQYFVWQDVYVEAPGLAHTLQTPATVLGGSLLGIMLGLWLPQRVTPVLTMVALVAVSMALGSDNHRYVLFTPMVSWVDWGPYDGKEWYALESGNPGPHVVYLLGLCGMAAVAALLRATTHRRLAVALGFVSLAVTVWGGMSQLP